MFSEDSAEQRLITPNLLATARKLEERSPGLHVLAAREFRYPVRQYKVGVRAGQYRRINLLEKFVLRAYAEISPPPSREELARALGLDPVFIRNTFNDLVAIQHIYHTREGLYLTEEGKNALASETVSRGSVYEVWYLLQDALVGTEGFSRQPYAVIDEELEDLSPYIKKDLAQLPAFKFDLAELLPRLQEMGLDLHNPDESRVVTELLPEFPDLCWKQLAIFVLYDTLNENTEKAITIQARSEGRSLPQISEMFQSLIQDQTLSLKILCGLSDEMITREEWRQNAESIRDPLVEERLEEIRQQAKSQLRLTVKGQTLTQATGTAIQLRDIDIRPAFLQALQEAREQIIIYSPWINEQVVDEPFLLLMEDLVQKGVHILIGYGIGREEMREDRPIPPMLRQRFRSIQTSEGIPGVIVEWLGNSHAKEIIIDRKTHFSGSHNWLSYRGDRFPRGETVYQVTITAEVEKAHTHLSSRFIERAKILWSRATDEERKVALCILSYLEREQEVIGWIRDEKCYHLIPLWLTLARQAVIAGHIARILAPLKAIIILCSTAIEPQNPLRTEIVMRLQDVLKAMPLTNQELITFLAGSNLSELKQLGPGYA